MNKRLRKKRLKAKWNVKKIPKWIPFAMFDECMTKMKTRLEESLDNTLLFGEQIGEQILNGMPLWSPVQLIYGQGNPLSIRVTGKCIITDCLEPLRLVCTGCPFYEEWEVK